MSNAKEKAEELVNSFRMILMNEDTDCGNEILCTSIAKKNALICINEMIRICYDHTMASYYGEVKQEIEKL